MRTNLEFIKESDVPLFIDRYYALAEHPSGREWQRPSFSAGNLSVLLLAHWDHLLSSYIYRGVLPTGMFKVYSSLLLLKIEVFTKKLRRFER